MTGKNLPPKVQFASNMLFDVFLFNIQTSTGVAYIFASDRNVKVFSFLQDNKRLGFVAKPMW
jgi:hypothetical protein